MSTLTTSNITGNPTSSLGQITSNSNTATFGTSVYFLANGNVGIGTATPSTKLTSNGIFRAQSTTGTGFLNMYHDGTNGALVSNTGSFLFYAEGTNSILFHTNAAQRGGFDGSGNFQFDSGYGSVATAYGCRAWVNFNGTGTVAIRSAGNVTSITDNNVGDYTVNFTTAMPDGNYSVTGVAQRNVTNSGMFLGIKQGTTPSTTQCVIATPNNAGTLEDSPRACVAFFR